MIQRINSYKHQLCLPQTSAIPIKHCHRKRAEQAKINKQLVRITTQKWTAGSLNSKFVALAM